MISGRARMEWVVAVKRRRLMESPHHETGSQDEVSILASEAKVSAGEAGRSLALLLLPGRAGGRHRHEVHPPPALARVEDIQPRGNLRVQGQFHDVTMSRCHGVTMLLTIAGEPWLERGPRRGRGLSPRHHQAGDAAPPHHGLPQGHNIFI